ncbi:MAG: AN1-type zinc finger domain-containing protein [Candidatus Thorarchaeota archaeon]
MVRCSLCGQDDLGFTCPYCNGVYCTDHRLPEGHGCPGIHLAKERAKRKVQDSLTVDEYEPDEDVLVEQRQEVPRRQRARRRKSRFSNQEKRDLTISAILVILVSISLQSNYIGVPGIISAFQALIFLVAIGYWWVPLATVSSLLLAYFVHEMAHKFTAQHYGMWAEFRMTTSGYYLSAIAILFSIPIFGTGVVFTSGADSLEKDGKTNVAGPLSNLIIAVAFALLSILLTISGLGIAPPVYFIFQTGIILNAILGAFNMIPFQPFDGGTVVKWSRELWAVLTAALIIMIIFGYFTLPMIYSMFST